MTYMSYNQYPGDIHILRMYSYWLVHTLHMYSYGLVHVVDIVPSPGYLDYVLMRSRSCHDLVMYLAPHLDLARTSSGWSPDPGSRPWSSSDRAQPRPGTGP